MAPALVFATGFYQVSDAMKCCFLNITGSASGPLALTMTRRCRCRRYCPAVRPDGGGVPRRRALWGRAGDPRDRLWRRQLAPEIRGAGRGRLLFCESLKPPLLLFVGNLTPRSSWLARHEHARASTGLPCGAPFPKATSSGRVWRARSRGLLAYFDDCLDAGLVRSCSRAFGAHVHYLTGLFLAPLSGLLSLSPPLVFSSRLCRARSLYSLVFS